MAYVAPLAELRFQLACVHGLDRVIELPGLSEVSPELCDAVLNEAARFSESVLAPLNKIGDTHGTTWQNGRVTTAPGWRDCYRKFVEGGWTAPAAAPEHGGTGLPWLVNACVQEMFQGANMAFQLCPMLTQGAVEALELCASDHLKSTYLPRLIAGEWSGTMNLTESQAGSDLAAIGTRAEPDGEVWRIRGQKIFITYGAHDLTGNIIHLVLARLPGAPAGVKGLSLFLVPQFLVDDAGNPGPENDVRCVSIERKLGIHGSPTCTLAFGDREGAVGYLVGEPHMGLGYMFTMMNNTRLNVGLQGIGVAEHAVQTAIAYAQERRQGRSAGHDGSAAIIEHADVRRMLATMRVRVLAARGLALAAARSMDIAARSEDAGERARHQRRVDLLIPVVKGGATEMAVEIASLGIQVHGGMGYVEETGAAQFLRDARIAPIYEGTTGIQALDLVGRKIIRDKGRALAELTEGMRQSADRIGAVTAEDTDWSKLAGMVADAADHLDRLGRWLIDHQAAEEDLVGAAAAPTLQAFFVALGGWQLAIAAAATDGTAARDRFDPAFLAARRKAAAFYALHVFPQVRAQIDIATGGASYVCRFDPAVL